MLSFVAHILMIIPLACAAWHFGRSKAQLDAARVWQTQTKPVLDNMLETMSRQSGMIQEQITIIEMQRNYIAAHEVRMDPARLN